MVIYDGAAKFIETATCLQDRVDKVQAIIDALYNTALVSAGNDDIEEYMLDDGQSKIRTIYKGTEAVLKSIHSFEKIKQMYINQINGRVVRMVDSKSLRTGRNGRF